MSFSRTSIATSGLFSTKSGSYQARTDNKYFTQAMLSSLYKISSESISLCKKFDVYFSNISINNAKSKIMNAVRNEFQGLCDLKQ